MLTFQNVGIIIIVTMIFSYSFNLRLFIFLEKFGTKYDKQTKKASLWLIFSTLLSLTAFYYVVHLLLFP